MRVELGIEGRFWSIRKKDNDDVCWVMKYMV